MKKICIVLTLALLLIASVFVCGVAFADVAPWDVCALVEYDGDVFAYRLSDRAADAEQQRGIFLGSRGKRALCERLLAQGLPQEAVYDYVLPGFRDVTNHFAYVYTERKDACVQFGKNGFSYQKGQDGVQINQSALFDALLNSNGKRIRVRLPLSVSPAVTERQLQADTVLRGTFATSFGNSGANRCHNVELAASVLNGTTVAAGETFSFNAVVGERTESNGYKLSKVIVDGNYADGVGGGVCQVSTTLYNALLLAGFVPKAVRHSLVSSYVMAGFDAMVSYGGADLTFVNDTGHPIYIAASVRDKRVVFSVYGTPNPYEIVRVNEETRDKFATNYVVDAQKYPELVYVDQTKVLVGGSDGVKTRSYLKYYLDGKLVQTKLIRTDSYKRVDALVARGYLPREPSSAAE